MLLGLGTAPLCLGHSSTDSQSVAMAAGTQLCGLVSIISSCSLQKKQEDSPVLNEHFSLAFNLTCILFSHWISFYLFLNINFPWTFPLICVAFGRTTEFLFPSVENVFFFFNSSWGFPCVFFISPPHTHTFCTCVHSHTHRHTFASLYKDPEQIHWV